MSLQILLPGALRILAPLSLAAVSLADVRYVAASGNGHFTTIQAAVDGSLDGDVLLVRSGTYAGFTIDDKSLWIVADAGAVVQVNSAVIVRNLAASREVVVSRLAITGVTPTTVTTGQTALTLSSNAGHVRLQGCTLRGGDGVHAVYASDGGIAASVLQSSRVAFVGCSLTGGRGGGWVIFVAHAGNGGHGAVTQGSSVAFYESELKGGIGGEADYYSSADESGDGGDGCRVLDYGILASGCKFDGGWGGGTGTIPGDGGDGLVVNAGQAQLVANTYTGGLGGQSYFGVFGQNGSPRSGPGVFHDYTGPARKLAGPGLVAESSTVSFNLTGAPGDRVWLFQSPFPDFVYSPANAGIWLIALPILFANRPRVTLGATGAAVVGLPAANLAIGTPALREHWQCVVMDSSGGVRLGSPLHVAVLNCSDLLPDCDGNGSCDSCDLLLPSTVDCDHNGVPDTCEADCNFNGVVDACDILNGTSQDRNHNGIPDECETQQATWHVDANAAAGGNGSPALPFKDLSAAFAIALSGHRVLVRDGFYQGSANRNLDFAGRDLIVESVGGATGCIIDCQLLGRAFIVGDGVPSTARIQGFTIRNGMGPDNVRGGGISLDNADITVRGCRFEGCRSINYIGAGLGGVHASPLVDGCVFIGNIGDAANLYLASPLTRLVDCSFINNQGGVDVRGAVRFERCWFEGNSGSGILHGNNLLEVDQCVFVGNTSYEGGAIYSFNNSGAISGCTFVGNRATGRGGAVFLGGNLSSGRSLRNSIFWDNTAAQGTAIDLVLGPLEITWCDLQGGQASVTVGPQANLTWGPGNQNLDPLFVDPDGPDNNPGTLADNDYRLSLGSPCLDAGENASVAPDWFDLDGDGNVTEPVPFDFDGHARFVKIPSAPSTGSGTPPLVDLGAWERP